MGASDYARQTHLGRRQFMALVGAGALGAVIPKTLGETTPAAPARRPNVLVILIDDVGWADIGCYGCKDIPTPHIDTLARGGVRFTSGYVSAPLCSPTRAGIMTGRHQQRFGHEFNPGGGGVNLGFEFGLPLAETTFADVMKKAGYATGIVGKWHLGQDPKYQPPARGFDEFFGFLGGAHAYYPPQEGKGPVRANPIMRGKEKVQEKEYLTDAFAREAAAFIDRHKAEPFFLYFAPNAAHMPMQAPQRCLDKFAHIANERRRTHGAMMSCLDDGIGKVLARLKEHGLEESTLVLFVSDNGGPPSTTSSNGPLRGGKASMWEGGIREPFVIRWPGHVPAGRVYDEPVISLDFLPTAAAAAGAEPPAARPLDGVDLVPYLSGKKAGPPHEYLFWRMGAQWAVRKGHWKLVKVRDGPPGLYDLSTDIGESKDLSAEKPEIRDELARAYADWDKQLAKPLWGGRPANRPRKADTGRAQLPV